MKIKVALLQLNPGNNELENFAIAKTGIQEAASSGADVVLLPELWNVGYSDPQGYCLGEEVWGKSALTKEDKNFLLYQDLAKELNIAILFPYLERVGVSFANSAAMIDRSGKVVLNYQKVHTVDKGWEVLFHSGSDFPVAELNTKSGTVKIGCMICYDREFPEVARILMLNGAEIILVPNACDIDLNRLHQLQTRGYENMLGIAMTNYPKPKNNGRSAAYSGMRVKGVNDYDPVLALIDDAERIVYVDFDMDALREYRKKEIWGDAYRKPRLYQKLTENDPKEPFVRSNAKR